MLRAAAASAASAAMSALGLGTDLPTPAAAASTTPAAPTLSPAAEAAAAAGMAAAAALRGEEYDESAFSHPLFSVSMPSAAQGSLPVQGSPEWIFQSTFGVNGVGTRAPGAGSSGSSASGAGAPGASASGTTTESISPNWSDVSSELLFESMMAGGGGDIPPDIMAGLPPELQEAFARHMTGASTGESVFTHPQTDGSIFVSSFTFPDVTVPPPPPAQPGSESQNTNDPPSESQDGA